MRFSRKRQDESTPNFFQEFRRKHLFIATSIEKQCTRLLMLSPIDNNANTRMEKIMGQVKEIETFCSINLDNFAKKFQDQLLKYFSEQ